MRTCRAVLKRRDTLCNGTTGLYFERPDGFDFKPGQFAIFTLDSAIATDAGGSTRSLSIASAPHEKALVVAMRMRDSGFKRAPCSLPIRSPIFCEGTSCNFILYKGIESSAVCHTVGIAI